MQPTMITQSRAKLGGWAILFLVGGAAFLLAACLVRNPLLILLLGGFGVGAVAGGVGWVTHFLFPDRLVLDADGFELRSGVGGRARRADWSGVTGFFLDVNAIGFMPDPDAESAAPAGFGIRCELPIEWPMSRQAMVDLLNQCKAESRGAAVRARA